MVTITDVSRLGWERWGPATARRMTKGGRRKTGGAEYACGARIDDAGPTRSVSVIRERELPATPV